MADNKNLQFIDLADFTPGISTGYHSTTADEAFPDGFARVEETYGCYGLERGGLAPLPRITFSREGGPPATGVSGQKWPSTDDGYPADYFERIAVLDSVVVSPVILSPPLGDAVTTTFPQIDLFTCRQWYMVDNADTKVDSFWRFRGHPVYSGNTANSYAPLDLRAQDESPSWNPDPTRWKYGWGSIAQTRTQAPDLNPMTIGSPVLVAGMGGMIRLGGVNTPDEEGIECFEFFTYPNYSTDNGTVAIAIDQIKLLEPFLGAAIPGLVFGHQGRMMAIGRQSAYKYGRLLAYHGDEYGVQASTELVYYWPTNDVYNQQFFIAAWGEEQTSGYGTWHSMNANSLLLIKNKGGAVQVSGDVNSPAITRLPGVPSVGGLANRGAVTEKGYAYGTNSGVWIWTGSDTATNMSTMLEPDFWVPDDPTIKRRQLGQLVGSFAYSFPFIYAPNNWVLDMRKGGWFRYHATPEQDPIDGTTFAFNDVDYTGNLWATVASYELDTRFYCMFDQDTAQAKYVWQSQPIAKSRNRYLDIRQLTIVMAGKGRITVEITGLNGEKQKATINNNSDKTKSVVEPFGIHAMDIEVKITSEAADSDDAAPVLHRLSIGYNERQSIGPDR